MIWKRLSRLVGCVQLQWLGRAEKVELIKRHARRSQKPERCRAPFRGEGQIESSLDEDARGDSGVMPGVDSGSPVVDMIGGYSGGASDHGFDTG